MANLNNTTEKQAVERTYRPEVVEELLQALHESRSENYTPNILKNNEELIKFLQE